MTVRTHTLISPAHDVHLIEFSYLFVVDRSPNRFSVVHSLALSEKLNFLCAADREHNRIQCFDTELQWKYDVNFDKPVFAAAFKPNTGQYSATCIMSLVSCHTFVHPGKLKLHVCTAGFTKLYKVFENDCLYRKM